MAIYLRGNQWWIELRYQGKRYREAVGPDRELAIDVLAKRRVEIRENKFFPQKQKPLKPINFHDFIKEYLPISFANKKQSTKIKTNELSIMRNLDKVFGEKNLGEITNWNIDQWRSNRKKEVKPGTVNRELTTLKTMFKKAIEWKKIKENPTVGIKLFQTQGRLRYLMPDEVDLLLSNCSKHLKPIVTVAVHTGMRRGEILTLQKSQVDFKLGIITLPNTKNGTVGHVPIDQTVTDILRSIEGDGEYYFKSMIKRGEPLSRIDKAFGHACEKSGISDFHFHDLRHTFASAHIMNGTSLYELSVLLRHKNVQMTQRYAHLAPNHMKERVRKLDEVLGSSQFRPQGEIKELKVVNL